MTTTKTPNGISLGQQVTFMEFGKVITCTVIGLLDGGLRVMLDDGDGYIGYGVACRHVTPVATPAVEELTVGAKVTYSGNYNIPVEHIVIAVTPAGLRLDDGFGDIGYAVDPDQVTLVEAAPIVSKPASVAVVIPEPTPTTPAATPAPTTRRPPLLTKRPIPARSSQQMSPTAAHMIADLGCNAEIGRGRGPARLDVTQIRCLHDRGYLIALTDPRNHSRITGKGVQRALQLVTYTLAA